MIKNMNNAMNIASQTPQKTSDAIVSSAAKNGQNAQHNSEAGELEASARSFHDSIKQAYDDSKNSAEAENADKESSGNNLPEEDDFPELAADDDRPLMPGGLYLSGELSTDKAADTKKPLPALQTPAAESDIENTIDSDAEAELQLVAGMMAADNATNTSGKLGETSSQLRSMLNNEASNNTKTQASRGITTGADGSTEKMLDLKAEAVPIKTESVTLTADKFQSLINTGTQQQPLQNIQASLLLQAASAQTDAGDETLPLVSNAPANSFSSMNLSAPVTQPGIAEAFGRPGWSQAMGKQILMMVNQNINTAEIRLNPAHLGPIEVLIDMSDEQVSVSMSSRHAIVRDAMEQALPRLREMLEQNGYSLADADISKHSFAEQREQNSKDDSQGIAAGNINLSSVSDDSQSLMKQTSLSTSMVDYYI